MRIITTEHESNYPLMTFYPANVTNTLNLQNSEPDTLKMSDYL